jgi:hypothetical protein
VIIDFRLLDEDSDIDARCSGLVPGSGGSVRPDATTHLRGFSLPLITTSDSFWKAMQHAHGTSIFWSESDTRNYRSIIHASQIGSRTVAGVIKSINTP